MRWLPARTSEKRQNPATGGAKIVGFENELRKSGYVSEFARHFEARQWWENFKALFASPIFDPRAHPRIAWVSHASMAAQLLYLLSLALALLGRLGPLTRKAALALLAFQALHALWFYAYGRFNFVVMPLAAFVMARGLTAVVATGRSGILRYCFAAQPPSRQSVLSVRSDRSDEWVRSDLPSHAAPPLGTVRRVLFLAVTLIAAFTMLCFGQGMLLRQHAELELETGLNAAGRERAIAAAIWRLDDDRAWLAPPELWFVYEVGTRTGARAWLDAEDPDFSPAAFDPRQTLDFLRARGLRCIATRRPLAEWLDRFHIPAAERAAFAVRYDRDGWRLIERR